MIEQKKRYVLILGGTNFMGKSLLDQLQQNGTHICCINRGRVYWNNEAKTKHPEVQWFCADRRDHKDYTASIKFAGKHLGISEGNKWLAVIDFCGFKWRDVQSSLKGVQGMTQKYIFISSDSVYNNFIFQSKTPITEDHSNLEEQYQKIKKKGATGIDRYGYNKMKCELYLQRRSTVPYVCLRLPDVIGPYDNTNRFWTTLRWLKESAKYPLDVSTGDQFNRISLVDSESVAGQIVKLVGQDHILSREYNLAFRESCTVTELLGIMQQCSGYEKVMKTSKSKSSNQMYPSVQCGAISSQRAITEIGWDPIPLNEAVRKSVTFFNIYANNYPDEAKEMEREYRKKIVEKQT